MNINELTIGQAKELAALFGNGVAAPNLYGRYIGLYVIVRSRNEGVNAGTVVAADNTGIILSNARRLWRHRPKDEGLSWYEGVARSGLSSDSQISAPVGEKAIVEDYSVTVCSEAAKQSIEGFCNEED